MRAAGVRLRPGTAGLDGALRLYVQLLQRCSLLAGCCLPHAPAVAWAAGVALRSINYAFRKHPFTREVELKTMAANKAS